MQVLGTVLGMVIGASVQPTRHPPSFVPASVGPPVSPPLPTSIPPSTAGPESKPVFPLLLPHACIAAPAHASTTETATAKPTRIRCIEVPPSAPGHRVAERRRVPVEVVEDDGR